MPPSSRDVATQENMHLIVTINGIQSTYVATLYHICVFRNGIIRFETHSFWVQAALRLDTKTQALSLLALVQSHACICFGG